MKRRSVRWPGIAVACATVLAACGGGGDAFVLSENTVAPALTTTTLSTAVLRGTLIGALTEGSRDLSVLVVGDSTGDAPDEWVFLAFQQLAEQFPAYTFRHHPWDEKADTWGESRRLRQGTGVFSVDVWNFSASGKNTSYALGHRFPTLVATDPDQIVISHGKNEGLASNGSVRGQMLALTESLRADLPSAPITLVLQPPNRGDDEMGATNEVYRELADDRGFALVDVYEAFVTSPDPDALIEEDGIHPTTAADAPAPDASQLWAETFIEAEVAATADPDVAAVRPSTLLDLDAEPIMLERFEGPWPAGLPAGWELFGGASVTEDGSRLADPTAPGGAVARVEVAVDETGGIRYQWSNEDLESLRGKRITAAVRVHVEDGQPVGAGRIGWADGVSVVNSGNYAWARDGWHWRVLTFTVDPEASYLRLTLYADTASGGTSTGGGDGTVVARFGRLTVAHGGLPHDLVEG